MKKALVVLALMSYFSSANALTGNELLDLLRSNVGPDSLTASSYISGVSSAHAQILFLLTLQEGKFYSEAKGRDDKVAAFGLHQAKKVIATCPPAGVTNGQIVDIVRRYLEEHPEQRTENSALLVIRSVRTAFPCPTDNGAVGNGKEG